MEQLVCPQLLRSVLCIHNVSKTGKSLEELLCALLTATKYLFPYIILHILKLEKEQNVHQRIHTMLAIGEDICYDAFTREIC